MQILKNLFIIILLIAIFPKNLYQQNNVSSKCSKYGIRYFYYNGKHVVKNQRKQLLYYLSFANNDKSLKAIDKHGNIKILDDKRNDDISYNIALPDSLVGIFEIREIIEKKDNYQKIGNKLVKRKIYYIALECIEIYNDTCPRFIRLISIEPLDKKLSKKNEKIQIGNKYKMKIYSIFSNDRCKYIDSNNEVIFIAINPYHMRFSYMIYDIWVPYNIDILNFNLYETPNLKGLYYYELE